MKSNVDNTATPIKLNVLKIEIMLLKYLYKNKTKLDFIRCTILKGWSNIIFRCVQLLKEV